jgi:hypothetical protein
MRSRSNTIAFRTIQFHRGNPESPGNPEYPFVEKIERKIKADENRESEEDKDLKKELTSENSFSEQTAE